MAGLSSVLMPLGEVHYPKGSFIISVLSVPRISDEGQRSFQ